MPQQLPYNISQPPELQTGQKNVLELQCEPIETVRIAFIGLGMRVSSAIKR